MKRCTRTIWVDDSYFIYNRCKDLDIMVKENGKEFVGNCWPGDSVWIDFLNYKTYYSSN